MPIILEANYSKKIGLPQYSSHQFMVTLRTEITDLSTVQAESDRLYGLLQTAVDTSLQRVGYLPEPAPKNGNGNGNGNGHNNDAWQCSTKQRELILKITDEHKLDKVAVDQLALDRFGKGVRQLNKLEASGLIDELLEQTGQKSSNQQRRFNERPTQARAA
jgi:hypothetical protein